MTKSELQRKLKALGKLPDATKREIVCALIGHSRIQRICFGYVNCARCDAQVGDTVGGAYDLKESVLVGHDCETCRANCAKMDWRHKYLVPDPFKKVQA